MFTKKLEDQFSKDLLDAVKGVLDEEKKCKDCGCKKCECEDEEDDDEDEKEEMKEGLWANIHAKRERIKRGSGERMRKPGSKGAPTAAALQAAKEEVQLESQHEEKPPFEGGNPVRRHYDKQGNEIKNVARHLARKNMKKAAGEKVDEAWVVKKGTEVVSTHKSKDEADVKAMKHPLYKVVAKEEVEIEEAALKSNKDGSSGSRGTTFSSASPNSYKVVNNKGEHLADALNMKDPKYGGRTTHWHVTWHKERHKDHPTSFQYMHQLKKHIKGLDEEVEIEEAVGDITVKKMSSADAYKKHTGQDTKKASTPKDPKTGKTLYQKVTSEEAEQIDELSKATMGRYINKAAERMSTQGVTAGLKIAADEKSKKNFDNIKKREKGIARAVNKLTKEEVDINEAFSLSEAGRGRPKKYEINPNTKEKLHYDNPEHMKRIELLRKKGVLAKPNTEPGEHIINQLRKAAVSMTPHHVKFRNGQKHPISNTHAQRALDKYASLKPAEKETYQHEISRSHEDFKKNI